MIEWTILIGAKVLKLAILGLLSLISYVASDCCSPEPSSSAQAWTEPATESTVPVTTEPVSESTILVDAEPSGRLERVGRLVPPVRVEMTFTPDLLVPPRRDPSL